VSDKRRAARGGGGASGRLGSLRRTRTPVSQTIEAVGLRFPRDANFGRMLPARMPPCDAASERLSVIGRSEGRRKEAGRE